jgi:pyrroline-5-carboxylate reductase
MARPVINAMLAGNKSLVGSTVLQPLRQMSSNAPNALVKAAPSRAKPIPQSFVREAVRKIFREHFGEQKLPLSPTQLQKISLNVQEIMKTLKQGSLKDSKLPQDFKPFSEEELRRIIGERIATMTVGDDKHKETILVFGFGNMARAISEGLDADVEAIIHDESKPRIDKEGAAISYLSKTNPAYQQIFAKTYSSIILSVKPQKLGEIAPDLKELKLEEDSMVISVLAGISTKILASVLPENALIVRTMPNTPLAIGYGVTGVFLPKELEGKKEKVLSYFGAAENKVVFVDREEQINHVTGISGSGPAYFFMIAEEIAKANVQIGEKRVFELMKEAFGEVDITTYEPQNDWRGGIKAMVASASESEQKVKDFILSFTKGLYEKGVELGFSSLDAQTLAVGTAIGSGEYGYHSEKNAQTLRENVTSPGGTTFEALKVFREVASNSLNELVGIAVQAASDKAGALGAAAEEKFLATKAAATQFSPIATSSLAANTSTQQRV